MQPVANDRMVTSNGSLSSGMFGMSAGSEAHIFGILRNTLYANKELALLREYGTNAWDAHIEAGVPDEPIKVVLPTDIAPTLIIRDYGRGLSEADVFGVYNQYGASTKRGSNEYTGFLGIGSKSAFCYSDSFTITSFHDGKKSVYIAVIDETNVGRCDKKYEEPLREGERTGIEIRIPVDPKDIPAFHREASFLFPHFYPLPDVNLPVTPCNRDSESGYILPQFEAEFEQGGDLPWIAVMGVVPYRLDFSKMKPELQRFGLDKVVDRVRGVLRFKIGEISVSASREEIEYSTGTKNAVAERLRLMFAGMLGDVERTMLDPNASDWAKRLATRAFCKMTGLRIPEKYKPWAGDTVDLYTRMGSQDGDGNTSVTLDGTLITGLPTSFRMLGFRFQKDHSERRVSKMLDWGIVEVEPDACLFLRDTNHSLRGYNLGPRDRVIDPINSIDSTLPELLQRLEALRLTGIPVRRLSELSHEADTEKRETPHRRPSARNEKHIQTQFVLRDADTFPLSENWDIVQRVPAKDDVFVVLNRFEVDGSSKFYAQARRDRRVIGLLGGHFPPVYGYKHTVREPVDRTTLEGIQYKDWRTAETARLLDANVQVREQLEDLRWAALFSRIHGSYGLHPKSALENIGDILGSNHPLVFLFQRHLDAVERLAQLSSNDANALATLRDDLSNIPWEADRHIKDIYERYPLLQKEQSGHGFRVLSESFRCKPWISYINLVDQVEKCSCSASLGRATTTPPGEAPCRPRTP